MAIAAMVCCLSVAALGADYDAAGFESPTFITGLLTGQDGWAVVGGDPCMVTVQTDRAFSSTQAVRLGNDGANLITRKDFDAGSTDFWVTYWVYPAPTAQVVGNFTFRMRDSSGRTLITLSFNSGGGINGTSATYAFGRWNCINVHVKGGTETFDLYVNGFQTDNDHAFDAVPTVGRYFGIFDFYWTGNAGYTASTDGVFLDDFAITAAQPATVLATSDAIYDTYDFESPVFAVGPLSGQHGWEQYGDTFIQDDEAQAGSQALGIAADGSRIIARRTLNLGSKDPFWVDYWCLMPQDETNFAQNLNMNIRSNGLIFVSMGLTPTGSFSGLGGSIDPSVWNRFTLLVDPCSATWDLYVNASPAPAVTGTAFLNPLAGTTVQFDLDWYSSAADPCDGAFFDGFQVTDENDPPISLLPESDALFDSYGFEDPPYQNGPLNGQNGWIGSATDPCDVAVQDAVVYAGDQALQLAACGSRTIARKTQSVALDDFWMDFRIYPADPALMYGNMDVNIRDSAGVICFYMPLNSGGGISGVAGATYTFDAWNRFTCHVDQANETYDLYIDEVLAASDIAFNNPVSAGRVLSTFDFDWTSSAGTNPTDGFFIDDFTISEEAPIVLLPETDALYDSYGFEDPPFEVGTITGQDSWSAALGDVQIQTAEVAAGTQAMRVVPVAGRSLARRYFNPAVTAYWVDFWMYCPADAAVYYSNMNLNLRSSGVIGLSLGTTSSGSVSGVPGSYFPLGQWNHFSLYVDEVAESWDLYINNVRVGSDLAFNASPGAGGFDTFDFDWTTALASGDVEDSVYVDDFRVTEVSPVIEPPADRIYDAYGFEDPPFTPGTVDYQAGWRTSYGGPTATIIQSDKVYAGDQALRLKSLDAQVLTRCYASLGDAEGDIVIDYMMYPPASSEMFGSAYLRVRDATNTICLNLGLTSSGQMSPAGSITFGQWTRVTLVIRPDAESWDLYLNGAKAGEDLDFYQPITGDSYLSYLDFDYTGNADYSDPCTGWFIDDFQVAPSLLDVLVTDCDDMFTFGLGAPEDLNQDCRVNAGDLALLADAWLDCTDPVIDGCAAVEESTQYVILSDTITVDGDLSDWADATWFDLDKVYAYDPCDIVEAKFAVKWNETTNKVYAAVVVDDGDHVFENTPTNWNSSDRIEVYSQGDPNGAIGYGAGGTENFDKAQQYAIGPKITSGTWANWGTGEYLNPVASGLEKATVVNGSVITYEIGVPQYIWNGALTYEPTVIRDVTAGDIVGLDIIANTKYADGFGMYSENLWTQKYYNASKFRRWLLADALPERQCGEWGYLGQDLNRDCTVDLLDFVDMAGMWLFCNDPNSDDPACAADGTLPNPDVVYADEVAPGWDPADATACLQNAINTGASTVIVRNMYYGASWRVRPLFLTSNQTIIFEDGVEVIAKADEFHGGADMLFRGTALDNVTLSGYGATLAMRKSDYQDPGQYTPSESRMAIGLYGCNNVTIEGLNIIASGGDGIYISAANSTTRRACSNVILRDLNCDDHHRQGISIISVDGLLAEDCKFNNTIGTAPAAGLDIEPNAETDMVNNVVFRRCEFKGNAGAAVTIGVHNLNANSDDISVLIEDCELDGTKGTIYAVNVSTIYDNTYGGYVTFKDSTITTAYQAGVRIANVSGADGSVQVTFDNVDIADAGNYDQWPVYLVQGTTTNLAKLGNVQFINGCTITDDQNRDAVSASGLALSQGMRNVTGAITVTNPYGVSANISSPNNENVTLTVTAP